MRKIYVLYKWTPELRFIVVNIYSSMKKAVRDKEILEKSNQQEFAVYSIETEILH